MIIQIPTRTLRILLLSQCNLSCFYCNSEWYNSSYSILNYKNYTDMIQACIDKFKIERVKFSGGEPFMRRDLDVIISSVKKTNNIDISIVTNGTFPEKLETLLTKFSDLDLAISFPTANKNIFAILTNTANKFNEVEYSISIANERLASYKINSVLIKDHNDSEEEIERTINYFYDMPNNKAQIRFLETVSNDFNYSKVNKCISNRKHFDEIMAKLNFIKIPQAQEFERSSSIYKNTNGRIVKLIKTFCIDNCKECPVNKTSLWLCPDGILKTCAMVNDSYIKFDNWDKTAILSTLSKYRLDGEL